MSSRLHPAEDPEKVGLMDPEVGGVAGSKSSSRRQSETANPDFMLIKIIARISLSLIRRFWAFSGAALLALILFYWLYGGLLSFALVIFGITGVLYKVDTRYKQINSKNLTLICRLVTNFCITPTNLPTAEFLSQLLLCLIFHLIICLFHQGKIN